MSDKGHTINALLIRLEQAVLEGSVQDGMVLVKALEIITGGADHRIDQLKAAFDSEFGLTEADWLIRDTELQMEVLEDRPYLRALFLDEDGE